MLLSDVRKFRELFRTQKKHPPWNYFQKNAVVDVWQVAKYSFEIFKLF